MEDLNNIINKLDLNSIHQTLHSVTADYTFFLSAHRTPNDMDRVLVKKQSNKQKSDKFKRIEIIQSILSDHNEIKQEINNRKIFG